jgi:murein L,D-transpeptidase YcbB/YkuD
LKGALNTDTLVSGSLQYAQLSSSANYYRWMHHFHLDSFIVINIASATLRYYKNDTTALSMRTIVGTSYNRTPRFAAHCKEVTLYPYWNMPRSILVKEWLASFRRNPGLISFLNMELIDGRGRVISPSSINWKKVSRSNFPYRIRQKPGCFNPMGVVKFTLTSPYDVYLHDTNFKGAFLSRNRYYSHGCIRIEEPISLADAVLTNKVDADFLNACYKDQQPQVIPLSSPIPVFVVYMCAEGAEDGSVNYYKDVYSLLK